MDLPAVSFPGGGEVDEHLVLRVQPAVPLAAQSITRTAHPSV